jgi:hypothetical protein
MLRRIAMYAGRGGWRFDGRSGMTLLGVGVVAAVAAAADSTPTAHLAAPVTAGTRAAVATPRSPNSTPGPVTETHGAVPALLAGTWLVMLYTKIGTSAELYRNAWLVYRLTRVESEWHLQELDGTLPFDVSAAIEQANADGKQYAPDRQALRVAAKHLVAFTAAPEAVRFRRVVLRMREPAEPTPASDAAGTILFLDVVEANRPNVVGTATSYAATEVTADRVTGSMHATAMLNVGVGATPLRFDGQFVMFRLR